MQTLWQEINAHPAVTLMAIWWVFSAAISAMPEPVANGNKFYVWLYAFLHLLAANIDKVIAAKSAGKTSNAAS